MHIVLQGSCTIDVQDDQHTLYSQQAIIIAPGQYHRPKPTAGHFERLSVSFSIAKGPLLNDLCSKVPICKIYPVTEEIVSVCQEIFHEDASRNPFKVQMIQTLLTKLLISNFRILNLQDNGKRTNLAPSDGLYTEKIDDFFEVHLADNTSAQTLARELNLSLHQLSNVMKQTYGIGFREKRILARMDHAAWLLRSTEKPACEIAGEIGYSSEAAFYQIFLKRFQMTPQQYRLQHRKGSNK